MGQRTGQGKTLATRSGRDKTVPPGRGGAQRLLLELELLDEFEELFELELLDELLEELLDEFDELLDELLEELFEELLEELLEELFELELLERLLRSKPAACAARFIPRSQDPKKRWTAVSGLRLDELEELFEELFDELLDAEIFSPWVWP